MDNAYSQSAPRSGLQAALRSRQLRRIVVAPVAAAFLFGAAACGGDSGGVPSDAIAVVGKQAVVKSELDRLLDQTRANSRRSGSRFPKAGTEQYRQIREQLIQYLVRRAQLAAEADALGIEISDEQVEERRAGLVQHYFDGNEKLYEKQLAENGVTDDQMRADLKAKLIEEAVLEEAGKDVKVSDAELRRHYAMNMAKYGTPARREIRQILLKPEQGALARSLADQLRSGASFEQLARRHSQDPRSKNAGGRLEISKGETLRALENVVFSIPKREISDPIRTQFGWHVVQALGSVQPAKMRPFRQVKNQIREELVQLKRNEQSAKYVADLARKYNVTYQAGFRPARSQPRRQ